MHMDQHAGGKLDYIEGTLAQTTGADDTNPIPSDSWIFNYTSCAKWLPFELTKEINPKIFEDKFGEDKSGYIDNRRLGMVMLNFVDRPMSSLFMRRILDLIIPYCQRLPVPEAQSVSVRGRGFPMQSFPVRLAEVGGCSRRATTFLPWKISKTGKTFKLKIHPG